MIGTISKQALWVNIENLVDFAGIMDSLVKVRKNSENTSAASMLPRR